MRMLITGSNGFLGYHLCLLFSKSKNYTIHATYNQQKPVGLKRSIKLIKVNLCDIDFKKHYDIVIHCASKTRVNSKNNKKLYDDNVISIKEILNKISFDKFFFMSSNSVYGNVIQKKINEHTKLNAKDFYGRSKIKCEQILEKYSQKNHNKIFIFRLPAAVGIRSHSNFISNLMFSYKSNNFDLITINNKNDLFNNTIHAIDIYKFVKKLLTNKKTKKFNLFVLGSKTPIKLEKIISIYEKFFKKKIIHKSILSKNHNKIIGFHKALRFGFKPLSTSNTILKMLVENNNVE